MNSAQFTRLLVERAGLRQVDTEQRVRLLREAGLVVQGGHGRHAPALKNLDASTILLSLSAPSASKVVGHVTAMTRLRSPGRGRPTLGVVLAGLLGAPVQTGTNVARICLSCSDLSATIDREDRSTPYSVTGAPVPRSQKVTIVLVISGLLLAELGMAIRGEAGDD